MKKLRHLMKKKNTSYQAACEFCCIAAKTHSWAPASMAAAPGGHFEFFLCRPQAMHAPRRAGLRWCLRTGSALSSAAGPGDPPARRTMAALAAHAGPLAGTVEQGQPCVLWDGDSASASASALIASHQSAPSVGTCPRQRAPGLGQAAQHTPQSPTCTSNVCPLRAAGSRADPTPSGGSAWHPATPSPAGSGPGTPGQEALSRPVPCATFLRAGFLHRSPPSCAARQPKARARFPPLGLGPPRLCAARRRRAHPCRLICHEQAGPLPRRPQGPVLPLGVHVRARSAASPRRSTCAALPAWR